MQNQQQQPLQNEPVLYSLHLNKKYELLYNLGVIQLFNKQPLNAFDCFIECINKYKTNTRIWLRISECCIMIYRQNEDVCKLNERLKCVNKSIGLSIYHKIVFASKLTKQTPHQSLQTQQPCLEFAYACLKNAYYILTNVDEANLLNNNNNNGNLVNNNNNTDGYVHEKLNNISPQLTSFYSHNEFYKLKCSILTSLAYVSLCCYDYLNAIKYCNYLLVDCKSYLSKGNRYLAQNYLSEALVYADKLTEAIENLNLNINLQTDSDISFDVKQIIDGEKLNKNDLYNWYPREIETARAIVYYNLSVAHSIRGEIDLAYRCFDKCVIQFGKMQPANTYFMKIYLDLLDGNRQSLQTLLRDYFSHATLNRTHQSLQSTPQNFMKSSQTSSSSSSAAATTTPAQVSQSVVTPNSTNPIQFLSNPSQLVQQQQSQLQNLNPTFLQSHPQFLQLAAQQQQQQQFFNQFNPTANTPSSPFNLQNAFEQLSGASQFQTSSNTTNATTQPQHINVAAAAAFQNLNSSAFNFTTQNVNQLLQQQQQQQTASQFHGRIN